MTNKKSEKDNFELEGEETAAVKRDYMLPASVLAAGIMISASIFYLVGSNNAPQAPTVAGNQGGAPVVIAGEAMEIGGRDAILGEESAPVTLIEYGDFQCPFCARFHAQVSVPLREDYIKTGKVRMVFRNFQFLGPESVAAANAAECAKDQGNFWAFHDAIYDEELRDGREHNGNLNKDLFLGIAGDLGMNVSDFTACVDGGKYNNQVAEDKNAAAAIGVNSTPTTFVNGQKIQGALPYEQFKQVIEQLLAGN